MSKLSAVILAAGAGTRMKSQTPKVLHVLAGRTLIEWVLRAAQGAGADTCVVVIGHQAEAVAKALPAGVKPAMQLKRLGTAHAVLCAQAHAAAAAGDLLVLCGDAPLIRPQTLRRLVSLHRRSRAAATVLTACVPDPRGYGRIVRSKDGRQVERIVEERDASPAERALREVNSGAYCFSQAALWPALKRIENRNRKGEYYLTDVVEFLKQEGRTVSALCIEAPEEILGINRCSELARAVAVLNRRSVEAWMAKGVTVLDPARTWIESGVKLGQDTVIWPDTYLLGDTATGTGCVLGPGTTLDSCWLGKRVRVRYSVLEHARVADDVRVGPFSHVRRGSRIGARVYIGNYVEINRSRIAPEVKLGHVCYIGDATIGRKANIGAGAITANYDGVKKHPTSIGAEAFIGSGTVIVAPSRVGRRAMTGAGAVLKRNTNIPAGTIAVGVPARVIKKR